MASLLLVLLTLLLVARAAVEPPHVALQQRRRLAQAVVDGVGEPSPSGAPQPALELQIIRPDQVYYPAKGVLAAPSVAVAAPPLNNASAAASSIEACSERCRATPGCDWWWFCGKVGGCRDGSGGTLAYQQCQQLGEACMLPALGLSGAQVDVTSGEHLFILTPTHGLASRHCCFQTAHSQPAPLPPCAQPAPCGPEPTRRPPNPPPSP